MSLLYSFIQIIIHAIQFISRGSPEYVTFQLSSSILMDLLVCLAAVHHFRGKPSFKNDHFNSKFEFLLTTKNNNKTGHQRILCESFSMQNNVMQLGSQLDHGPFKKNCKELATGVVVSSAYQSF